MTLHTKTEESEFGEAVEHESLSIAGQTAESRMKKRAEAEGYIYMVADTFRITTTIDLQGRYRAEASAIFAKVVRANDRDAEDEKSDDTSYAAPPAPLEW
jgi:hypothetical protein